MSIEIGHLDLFSPKLETKDSVVFCSVTLACMILGFLVQRSILKLLARREGRLINKLILVQQVSNSSNHILDKVFKYICPLRY